jgi:hypothetical protein
LAVALAHDDQANGVNHCHCSLLHPELCSQRDRGAAFPAPAPVARPYE